MAHSWEFLSLKRRKFLIQSWAGLFQKYLLCELPSIEIAPFIDKGFVRPKKELYIAFGVLIRQQTYVLSNLENTAQLAFDTCGTMTLILPKSRIRLNVRASRPCGSCVASLLTTRWILSCLNVARTNW
jgi:hypothetical protein